VTELAHPAYGIPRPVTPFASVLLENNPSAMTLDGTNTWLLRAPETTECAVVDPGTADRSHLARVAEAAGPVSVILITHQHGDHVGGAAWLAERTGAPVRAFDPGLCRDAAPLADGEVVAAAGLELTVRHTPGHTEDSVCFEIDTGASRAVLTGDTLLGRGTTVVSDLGDYLASLRTLATAPPHTCLLPGHGPDLPDLAETAAVYLAHREERLDQVRAALRRLGPDATPRAVVELVYADVDRSLWGPAEWSVQAQLDYLRAELS
jgi:glyoxylase-like metal-dependent hydrolase (beta-lactamase superfamily II)